MMGARAAARAVAPGAPIWFSLRSVGKEGGASWKIAYGGSVAGVSELSEERAKRGSEMTEAASWARQRDDRGSELSELSEAAS